ncbi:MAG: hypothetical protein Tsb002_23650 [Wenzhouxiangellaceae bacterium]
MVKAITARISEKCMVPIDAAINDTNHDTLALTIQTRWPLPNVWRANPLRSGIQVWPILMAWEYSSYTWHL